MGSNLLENSGLTTTRRLCKLRDPRSSGYFYENDYHTQVNFPCLDTMYSGKLLCDVVLVSQGMEIEAHKVILASCSAFFYFKFSSERKLGILHRIQFENITYETLSTVIGYFYKSRALITHKNVKEVLAAAIELAVPDLQVACWDFLQANLTHENCFEAIRLSVLYNCKDLVPVLQDFVVNHFSQIVKYDGFLQLTYDEIFNIVSKEISCDTEEDMLNCIIQWVRFDIAHRKQHIYSLLNFVHFSLISHEHILKTIEEEPWLKTDSKFMHELLMRSNKEEHLMLPKKRKPAAPQLMVVGFASDDITYLSVELYDFQKNIWLPGPEAVHISCESIPRVAIHGTTIYCLDQYHMKSIDISSIQAKQWKFNKIAREPIMAYSIAVSTNYIYVTFNFPKIAQKYDVNSGQWERIADMPRNRHVYGLGVLNEKLYSVGGKSFSNEYSNSLVSYNHNTDSWYGMPSMSVAREDPGVGTHRGNLIVVGGYNRDGFCKQVESFDPIKSTWSRLPDMNIARGAPGVISFNGQLYVIGGENLDVEYLNSVEIYDPKANTWSILPTSMKTGKRFVAAAVIEKSALKFKKIK